IPAPIPCEAPVTIAVFGVPFMAVYLETVWPLEKPRGSEIRVQHGHGWAPFGWVEFKFSPTFSDRFPVRRRQ
ncbi:MAG TPA: hypothetical protein VH985_01960, partial [Candidatus Binatia bacterium]